MTIGFLGIGLMGAPMAGRLLAAGFAVQAWNRTQAKLAPVCAAGAVGCATAAEAVQGADIIISILGDGPAVAALVASAQPAAGSLWIDMSSTRQSEALDIHAALAARGVRFVDAPVSGGVAGAQAGSLAIMAGGTVDDVAQAIMVLATLGRVTHVGPVGSGQVAKLCNQLIVGATLNVVAEALLLAQAAGADPTAVRAAIRGGFAESRILDLHGQRMLERNFMPGGKVATQMKDMENILAAAQAAGLSLPVASLVAERFKSIVSEHPNADHSAALLALEALNQGTRLGAQADMLPDQAGIAISTKRTQ